MVWNCYYAFFRPWRMKQFCFISDLKLIRLCMKNGANRTNDGDPSFFLSFFAIFSWEDSPRSVAAGASSWNGQKFVTSLNALWCRSDSFSQKRRSGYKHAFMILIHRSCCTACFRKPKRIMWWQQTPLVSMLFFRYILAAVFLFWKIRSDLVVVSSSLFVVLEQQQQHNLLKGFSRKQ